MKKKIRQPSYEEAMKCLVDITDHSDARDICLEYIEDSRPKKKTLSELGYCIEYHTEALQDVKKVLKELQKTKYPDKYILRDEAV